MSGLTFTSATQKRLFETILAELERLGYTGKRLATEYAFADWFRPDSTGGMPERVIAAAAFGQTPVSYDTACFGVTLANGVSGVQAIGSYRALAAPVIFEVGNESVVEWSVGVDDRSTRPDRTLLPGDIRGRFAENSERWTPREFLRTKTLSSENSTFQVSLFAGVIPELESNIRAVIDPVLRRAVTSASRAYRETKDEPPPEDRLFQLTFALLAGKVFRDRGHELFSDLDPSSGPDAVIARVAGYYDEQWPRLLTKDARLAAFEEIWSRIDFRNLSVDAVTHTWANTLVTKRLRKRWGIHRTPRSIVRYIVNRIPFQDIPEDERFVVEPFCGSAVFLVAALNRMRDLLDPNMDERARHEYFQRRLTGFERDSWGREAARLSLALTDYPQPNGWEIHRQDVFLSPDLSASLREARVVLCNPPFEDLPTSERAQYDHSFIRPPLEILNRVLVDLHPDGMLGFVLPQVFVSGEFYRPVREALAKRFASFDLVTLPDAGWEHAQPPTALLIATDPRRHTRSKVSHGKVKKREWKQFDWTQTVPSVDVGTKAPSEAREGLAVPALSAVWRYLRHHSLLGDKAVVHCGIQWWDKLIDKNREETGAREKLVRPDRFSGSRKGVPPKASPFYAYEIPPLAYLDMSREKVRRSYQFDWDAPKVILNSRRKSRDPWRIAAFVDRAADGEGLVCYQTFTAVWPGPEWNLDAIAAVLNGPVANAFIHSHLLDQNYLSNDFIERIPLPRLDAARQSEIAVLVAAYGDAVARVSEEFMAPPHATREAEAALLAIDAIVLSGYDLPPRLERSLLDYFRKAKRTTSVAFNGYFPPEFRSCVPLREYLSGRFSRGNIDDFESAFAKAPASMVEALRRATEAFGE